MLVSTDRVHVDRYSRQADGAWLRTSADSMEGALDLQSVGCHLSLGELYANLELAA